MRILFICPNWAGLATPIIKEMISQGHDVTHLDHDDFSDFSYFNGVHRTLAKLYQLVAKDNYKHRYTRLEIKRTISSFFISRESFDVVLMTEPNLFNIDELSMFKEHCNMMIATLWDSVVKSSNNIENLNLFDIIYSYDQEDCNKYGFEKINNYLDPSWCSNSPLSDAKYDVFSIMSFTKERYKMLLDFLDKNPHLTHNIYMYIDHDRKRKYIKDLRVKITKNLILGDELKQCIEGAKAILDLLQGHQTGLSFRVYESLGYKRKLITTNECIKNYDIYNEDNVFIIDGNNVVPRSFLQSEYSELSNGILDKYMLSSWVNKVLNNINN